MLLQFLLFSELLNGLLLVSGFDSQLTTSPNVLGLLVVVEGSTEVLGELVELGRVFLAHSSEGNNGSVFLVDESPKAFLVWVRGIQVLLTMQYGTSIFLQS